MVLWLSINVALPLLPLLLVWLLGILLDWRTNVLDLLSDGQLYFFSAVICATFAFDSLKAGKLGQMTLIVTIIFLIFLVVFYAATMMLGYYYRRMALDARLGDPQSSLRKLAFVSILLCSVAVTGVTYARFIAEMA